MSGDVRPIRRRMTLELMKAGVERAVDASEQYFERERLRGEPLEVGERFTALDALMLGLSAHVRDTGPLTEELFNHRDDSKMIAQIMNMKRAVANGAKWRSVAQLYARASKVTKRAALERAREVVDTTTFLAPYHCDERLIIVVGQLRLETGPASPVD